MKVSFSFDDGNELDRKTIEYLKCNGFKDMTFFVPIESWGFDNLHVYKDYKVGGHTWTHPSDLKICFDEALEREIVEATDILNKRLKYKMNIFAYPRGRFDDRVINYVKKAGYKYARTTRIGFDNEDVYRLHGYHMFQRREYGNKHWVEYILNDMNKNNFRWFHIWGHSAEIQREQDWVNVDKLLKAIKEIYPKL